MAAVLSDDVLYLIMSFLDSKDLATVSSLYDCFADSDTTRDLCYRLRDAAAPHRKRQLPQLFDKALEWVAANPGRAFIAGSAALYLHMKTERNDTPHWPPNDVDVFLLSDPDCGYHTIVEVQGPSEEERARLKFGGKFMNTAPGVVSTLAYPFGVIQIIYIGADFFRAADKQFPTRVRSLLDTFDHSAVMVATVDGAIFIYGPRFRVDNHVMYRNTSDDRRIDADGRLQIDRRFQSRYVKYKARGLEPVRIQNVAICGWYHMYGVPHAVHAIIKPFIKDL